MANTHPQLAKELINTDSNTIIAGTNERLEWCCSTCNHIWTVSGSQRKSKGRGCPACANLAIHSSGLNSMAVTHPKLAIEYLGDATKIVAGTTTRLDWKCEDCSHEWKSSGDNRMRGRGCPACQRGGFQAAMPGFYYVFEIRNEMNDVLYYKGGISSDSSRRQREIERTLPIALSIHLVELLEFELGQTARELETRILGIERIRAPPRMDFSGGSELFLANPIEYVLANQIELPLTEKQLQQANARVKITEKQIPVD